MSHIVDPTQVEGGQAEVVVSDDNAQELLLEILKELKKMNLHLSMMTDLAITSEEID